VTTGAMQVVRGAIPSAAAVGICADLADLGDSRKAGESVHRERLPGGELRLCRVERFTEVLATGPAVIPPAASVVTEKLGARAVLMKDKINIKWPGGGEYHCHQDSRAYPPDMQDVCTVGIALTPSNDVNGGLRIADGVHGLLHADENGCVAASCLACLTFQALDLAPGDAVLFDGFAPHFSGANTSAGPRSVAFLTFVPATTGAADDEALRERYYGWRAGRLAAGGGALSTINDFTGLLEQ